MKKYVRRYYVGVGYKPCNQSCFVAGLLIGLGESRQERLIDLLLLRELHQQYGHIQEIIIQNFR